MNHLYGVDTALTRAAPGPKNCDPTPPTHPVQVSLASRSPNRPLAASFAPSLPEVDVARPIGELNHGTGYGTIRCSKAGPFSTVFCGPAWILSSGLQPAARPYKIQRTARPPSPCIDCAAYWSEVSSSVTRCFAELASYRSRAPSAPAGGPAAWRPFRARRRPCPARLLPGRPAIRRNADPALQSPAYEAPRQAARIGVPGKVLRTCEGQTT